MKDHLKIFFNQYKYHFLVWSIYCAFEVVLDMVGTGSSFRAGFLLLYAALNIFLFYFHTEVILKNTLEGKKRLHSIGIAFLILIELAAATYIIFNLLVFVQKYISHTALNSYSPKWKGMIPILYKVIYFTGYSTFYYFMTRAQKQRQLAEEMEQQELKKLIQEKEIRNELVLTQNTFLRAQINLDFLISTLDHLYHKTCVSAPKAAESILSLTDIMQYALSKEASDGLVKLEKEINLIENFLLLHQARQVHQAQLSFSYSRECLPAEFIPLILMTLTENMLKHGKLDDPDNPAEIKITYENSILHIQTMNKEAVNSNIPSHGIGLKNIRERLSLAYGEMATFDYHLDSKGYFHTAIMVQI
ncbi:sensor histidine kinase [Pedobacter cryoconitis]|uniref:Histidine kinase n=1 Tax=Pedobacter cryoconitis TaxID=188932 RepID=A0A327T3T0_9SPHI|nr:histidine kinase [Pedobacter cryoconitis]RAJ34413.1 histidine kinase [Pedobacter cryoconitis]